VPILIIALSMRHQRLKAVKETLGSAARHLNFNAYADA